METIKPIIVLAGPSGAGKSTILTRLFKNHSEKFGFSVSHTTRQPRPSETDGVQYHFSTREAMLKDIEAGLFVENAEFAGNLYGTSKRAILDVQRANKVCVLDIEIQGVQKVKAAAVPATYLFIVPPSIEELERRLRGRGDTADEAIAKRLTTAAWELTFKDKEGFFDRVIVNEDLEKAYTEVEAHCLSVFSAQTQH